MMKKALLILAAAFALATTLSAGDPIPPCVFTGTCLVNLR